MRFPVVLLLAACAVEPDPGETVEAIHGAGAQVASQWQRDRAFKRTNGCTATRIGPRFAITAAHCQPAAGNQLNPYAGGPGIAPGLIDVTQVIVRPGVNVGACYDHSDNCWDDSNWFADLALLRLDAADEEDLEGPTGVLEWVYPGATKVGIKVGAGRHDSQDNDDGILKQTGDLTHSQTAESGQFYTSMEQINKGDSGGPIYVANRIAGTLWGTRDGKNRYTSMARHLHWILTNIGWRWRGLPPQSSISFTGTQLQSFEGSELECQYACEHTGACEAYSLYGNVCRLYDNARVTTASSAYRGAFKWGARSGNSGTVVGYARSSSASVVANVSSDGRVDEIGLTSSGWSDLDIHGTAPPVAGKISALVRADGISVVYFRSAANRLIELARVGGVWQWADLTNVPNAEPAASNPVGYVRADGVTAVVYRGAQTNRIIELRLGSRGWIATDLFAAAGLTGGATGDPSASVRSDNLSAVTFRIGSQIWELFQAPGGGWGWGWGVPSQYGNAPAAAGRPFGYTHRDGTNAIVYRSTANQIIELYLWGGEWRWGVIGNDASLDPTAYVRTDGIESIVYRNTSNQLAELANVGPWTAYNLTLGTGGPNLNSSPAVYHRHDGYNVVLGKSSANHVIEHAYKRGTLWDDYDLTASTGETP